MSSHVNGSHANGADSIPFDGYTAKLHKGEMVIPNKQAQGVAQASDITALLDAIKNMDENTQAALIAIAQNTGKTAKIEQKWDNDGMPVTRDYSDGNYTKVKIVA